MDPKGPERKITFVTCLLHLTPYDNYTGRTSIEDYFEHGKNILKQDIQLVIFIERKFEDKLKDLIGSCRPKVEDSDKFPDIHIIPTSLPEMPLWPSRDKFQAGMKPSGANQKMTPEYYLLTWSKFDMMKQCMAENPFKSSHFVWIDYGLGHVNVADNFKRLSEFEDLLQNNPDKFSKFRICKYWTSWYPLCVDFINTVSIVWSQTPGGLWMTTPNNFSKMYKMFLDHGNMALRYGKVCLEEDILTFLRNRYPDDFDLFYGTYDTLIQAFCGDFTMSDWSIRMNIQNMIQSKDGNGQSRSIELAKHVIQMIDSGKFKPEASLIPFLQLVILGKIGVAQIGNVELMYIVP